MSPHRGLFSVVVAGTLAGCTLLDPYATAPRAPSAGTKDAGARVAICYNTLVTTLAEIRQAAQQECSPNAVATPADTDYYLQNCPLLLPGRATFVCTPKATPKK